VLEDRIRVYFSTRTNDRPGRFLSHVQYVDYDLSLRAPVGYSEHEVLALGGLGCFDEHGIFPLSPTRVGEKVYGYTNGISRRVSVAVETGVGLAVSADQGRTFQRAGEGPLLSAQTDEPFLVGDPFVREFDGVFHMFYLFGRRWSEETLEHPSERVYKIGHATSKDGLVWQRDERAILPDRVDENECQALPTVLWMEDRYVMVFCYRWMTGFREDRSKGYRLGYAYSKDLVNWTRDDAALGIAPSEEGWDSEMMCYPNLFEVGGDVFLLYNGNHFGRDGFGAAKLVKNRSQI
jgi:predicted GH43/DUF377 family glycosyl hydrolase